MKGLFGKISFTAAILRAKITKEYKPFQVQLSVTDHCNLRCTYCYANYPIRGYKDLATDEILYIIDELASLGTRRVNIVGGEPLIRKDIGAIIDYIKDKKMECVMTSNGYLVAKKIEHVKKLDLLSISLDGEKEANDANRGKGSYEKAMVAIRIAKGKGIPLQVAAVITKDNLHSINYILSEGLKYGFSVGFSTLINQSTENSKVFPRPTDYEYREVLRYIIEMKKKGYPVLFSNKSLICPYKLAIRVSN